MYSQFRNLGCIHSQTNTYFWLNPQIITPPPLPNWYRNCLLCTHDIVSKQVNFGCKLVLFKSLFNTTWKKHWFLNYKLRSTPAGILKSFSFLQEQTNRVTFLYSSQLCRSVWWKGGGRCFCAIWKDWRKSRKSHMCQISAFLYSCELLRVKRIICMSLMLHISLAPMLRLIAMSYEHKEHPIGPYQKSI